MQHLIEIGVFLAKALVLTGAFIAIVVTIATLVARLKPQKEQLEVEDLNDKLKSFASALRSATTSEKSFKDAVKVEKKQEKVHELKRSERTNVFVVDFDGDIKASPVDNLRDEINAILSVAKPDRDEVVVRLESGGGMVHGYGLAAAQLLRLKKAGIRLTVCVDKIAASGGYMMACTAHQVLAAPFAIIGSIGVIAQVPNFHKLLRKHDIDYEEITAGEFKRTVSLFGEITDKGRQKFLEQIEDTHHLFKDFVHQHRPTVNLQEVATGEYWYGEKALSLGLIDKISSSDEYLFQFRESSNVTRVKIAIRKNLSEKISGMVSASLENSLQKGLNHLFYRSQS